MEPLEISFQPSAADEIHSVKTAFRLRNMEGTGKLFDRTGEAIAAAVILYIIIKWNVFDSVYSFLFLLLASLYIIYPRFIKPHIYTGMFIRQNKKKGLFLPYTKFSFGEDEVTISTENYNAKYTYKSIYKMYEDSKLFLLYFSESEFRYISKSAMTKGTARRLRLLLENNIWEK